MEQKSEFQNLILDMISNIHRWVSNLTYYLFKAIASFVHTIIDQIESF